MPSSFPAMSGTCWVMVVAWLMSVARDSTAPEAQPCEPAQPHARGSLGHLPARGSSKDVWGFSEHTMTQT